MAHLSHDDQTIYLPRYCLLTQDSLSWDYFYSCTVLV